YDAGIGWIITVLMLFALAWSHIRLLSVLCQHTKRSFGQITLLWMVGPVIVAVIAVVFLEMFLNISAYWSFFWNTIVQ
ncbi:MAG: hypothetical protein P9M15_07255, partial [Candidatus Electryoneaceae bacterium]|nr:hypothetical protein [Candidatus Electryoneaceae bacterium]